VRQHEQCKRRTWPKVHLAINPKNLEIIMSQLTDNSTRDAVVGETMLQKCGKGVANLYADGAYDKSAIYKLLQAKGISGKIPPRKDAKLQDETKKQWMLSRNKAINRIRELGQEQIATGLKK